MGTPVIASDCIGLQETVANTPAMMFSSENVNDLVKLMFACMKSNSLEVFQHFIPSARARYDIAKSAQKLVAFIEGMQELK